MANLMTKRHFEVIANALADARPPDDSQTCGVDQGVRDLLKAKDEQWMHTVTIMCSALETTNPAFDREVFTDWIQSRGRTKFKK